MGNGNHRLAGHQIEQLFLNGRFHLRIERRCRFVQNENGGIFQQHPGNRNALTLATRELDTALTHMGFKAAPPLWVNQIGDKLHSLGLGGSLDHFGFAGVRPPIQNVVAHRAVQQGRILCHHGNLAAQGVLCHLRNVMAIDGDAPAFHVIKPQQQVHQG